MNLFFGHTESPIPSSSLSILIILYASSPHSSLHSLTMSLLGWHILHLYLNLMSPSFCCEASWSIAANTMQLGRHHSLVSLRLRLETVLKSPRYLQLWVIVTSWNCQTVQWFSWKAELVHYSRTPDERPPSRATIPLIRPHQCDSEGGRIRGILLYLP